MRIAKPMLLVTTPIGVVGGLVEAYRLAGGLVIVMVAMVGVIGAAIAGVVGIIRSERKAAAQSVAAVAAHEEAYHE
jgi:hypothetical protein